DTQHLLSFPTRRSSDLQRRRSGRSEKMTRSDDRFVPLTARTTPVSPRSERPASVTRSFTPPRTAAGGLSRETSRAGIGLPPRRRSEEHTSELQSLAYLV